MATYERYCRERKATLDRERSLGQKRSLCEEVFDLIEISSSDDDRHGTRKRTHTKRGTSWSLSSNSIATLDVSDSADDDVENGERVSQKSIQSYTSPLFSPLYEVTKLEDNIFQENRRPLPKAGQTPKGANLFYSLDADSNAKQFTPIKNGTDVVSSAVPGSPWRVLLSFAARAGSSSEQAMGLNQKKNQQSRSSTLVFTAKLISSVSKHTKTPVGRLTTPTIETKDVYARKDWSLKSYASTDSGNLSLEPLINVDISSCSDEPDKGDDVSSSSSDVRHELLNFFDEEFFHKKDCNIRFEEFFPVEPDDCDSLPANALPLGDSDRCVIDNRISIVKDRGVDDSTLQIINIVEPTPERLFSDMLDFSYAALQHISLNTLLPADILLQANVLQFHFTPNDFGYSWTLQQRTAVRCDDLQEVTAQSAKCTTSLVSVQIPSADTPVDQSACCFSDDNIEYFHLASEFFCVQLGNWKELPNAQSPLQAKIISKHPQEDSESLLIDVENSLDLDCKIEMTAMAIENDDANGTSTKGNIHIEETLVVFGGLGPIDDYLVRPRKQCSLLSPTFSYDSHLVSLGSFDSTQTPPYDVFYPSQKSRYFDNLTNISMDSVQLIESKWVPGRRESSSTDNNDFLLDGELRAVMKITQDGDYVSPIFPSFSSDSYYLDSSESDDGLDSELGALEMLEAGLRQEIEAADSLMSGPGPWTSPTSASHEANQTWDSAVGPISSADHSSAFSLEANAAFAKRVHFNEEVQEFHFFINDACDDRRRGMSGEESIFDDVMGVIEDMIEEFSFTCVSMSKAMDRTRSYHSISRSAAH